jgi:hypothetical protein
VPGPGRAVNASAESGTFSIGGDFKWRSRDSAQSRRRGRSTNFFKSDTFGIPTEEREGKERVESEHVASSEAATASFYQQPARCLIEPLISSESRGMPRH